MLASHHQLLLALSFLPKVGRKTLSQILSLPFSKVLKDISTLQPWLSSDNFTLICEFEAGTGKVWTQVNRCIELLDQHNISFISRLDEGFPALLLEIPDCPPYLFYKGDLKLCSRAQIAIVGSRNSSRSGLQHAYQFSRSLAASGLVITSGLARGIDSAAHSGAIDIDCPSIAVMGTGLDKIYPHQHRQLAARLLHNGCWLSEYIPGAEPRASNFPRRNRIISGLSLGVLVVEAKVKSGTLITARMAIEQNREIFAIPGSIDFQGSAGCHNLISQGAVLVQSPQDIIDNLPAYAQSSNGSLVEEFCGPVLGSDLAKLLILIDYAPTNIDTLAIRSAIAYDTLVGFLSELELEGYIQLSGSFCQRIK